MIRVGKRATDVAKQLSASGSRWPSLCLKFVRTCLGVAAKYPSARAAFRAIPPEHLHQGQAPEGYPEWFLIGPFGHVTLSNGDGYSWSNITRKGGVIELVKRTMFGRYKGWSTHINGVDLPLPPEPPKPVKPTAGRTKLTTATWQRKAPAEHAKRGKLRPKGWEFRYVRVVKNKSGTYLVTQFGSYYKAENTKRGV